MIPFFDADHAGKNPPKAPMMMAKNNPNAIAGGPTLNRNATSLKVEKFPTPVVRPLIGRVINTPTIPPRSARKIDSSMND